MTQDELKALREKCDKPVALYRAGVTQADLWLCAACGSGYRSWANHSGEAAARGCCMPKECAHGLSQAKGYCRPCRHELDRKNDDERFRQARKVPLDSASAREFLLHGCFAPGDDTRIYDDVDYLLERDERPDYCWPAVKVPFEVNLDPYDELASWGSHVEWDGNDPEVEDGEELLAFLCAWNEKQTAYYLEPDHEVAIVIPEEEP